MSAVSIWETRLKYRAHHPSGKRKSPFNPKGCPGSPGRLPTPGPHRSVRALANAESYAASERVRLTITAADTHSQGSPKKIDNGGFRCPLRPRGGAAGAVAAGGGGGGAAGAGAGAGCGGGRHTWTRRHWPPVRLPPRLPRRAGACRRNSGYSVVRSDSSSRRRSAWKASWSIPVASSMTDHSIPARKKLSIVPS